MEVAASERNFKVKEAGFKMQVEARKADADLADRLQRAKVQQEIEVEEMSVKVIQRQKDVEIWQQEIERNEKDLEATVRRPAAAEKYRIETLAPAQKKVFILKKHAEADAIKLKGEAEAYAIAAKATAEAEAMQKKAEAWGEYKDAAIVDMVMQTLPKVAAEVAAPLSKAKIKMVAGPGGDIGASKITGEVLKVIADIPTAVKSLTGVDMVAAMQVK